MSQRSSGSQGTPVTEDERLLAQVPRERRPFVKSDSWRVLRIMGEFVEGFDTLSDVYNAVTVFGSARTKPEDPYYEGAVETAQWLPAGVAGDGKTATTDLRLFTVTDSPREAVATVRQARERRSIALPVETQRDAEVP